MITLYDGVQGQQPLAFFTEELLQLEEFKTINRIIETGNINTKNFSQQPNSFYRWPLESSASLLSLFPQRPEQVQLIEVFDSLLPKTSGEGRIEYWPELLAIPALKGLIRERVETLDLRGFAYILGDSAWLRLLSVVAAQLGFANIVLVSTSHEAISPHLKQLKRSLIGIHFEVVLTQELTLQPQHAELVFNALNLSNQKEALQDIAYFNFMASEGLFVNLMADKGQKLLHDEAERAHLKSIFAKEVELAWWREVIKRMGN